MLVSHLPKQSSTGETATKLTSEKLKLSSGGNEDDHGEETVSDTDLDDIIGISDSSALEVVQQPYVLPVQI
jgi:DNA repair protein RAD5